MMGDKDESPRPTKRVRKSCERCRTRKQRCTGFPVCSNCLSAKEDCKQPLSAIEEYRSGPNQALLERISYLESQLASYTNIPPPAWTAGVDSWRQDASQEHQLPASPASSGDDNRRGSIADIVGFLSLGGERAYVGASSGFSMASNLGQMVQATVWNKALAATVGDHQSKMVSLAEVKRNSAGPPNDEMGERILDAYFLRTHHRYPFLDRQDVMELHANRMATTRPNTPSEQFGTFKLNMIYAIGATLLKLTGPYDYTPPESFFMTALQYISAAREFNSIANIEAMALLVLYNLRSPSNSGIFFMIGLGMRTCVDLGLHREAHYKVLTPYEGQLRRRLFWSVYFLERVIAVSLGRPYSIADRDIDVGLPLEIDDTIRDDGLISRTQAVALSPTFQSSRPSSNLTLGIQCIRLARLESYIQTTIYRVDVPTSSLVPKLSPVLKKLEGFKSTVPSLPPSEADYLSMLYYKAIRLSIQPFLNILPTNDSRTAQCLDASGQISQIFKRLHQRDSYGHSFIALHDVFIAGVTMCYCLFLSPQLWTFTVAEDLRACSSALFVMAERTPSVKKYRDALETVISATMEYMGRSPDSTPRMPHSDLSNTPGQHRRMSSGRPGSRENEVNENGKRNRGDMGPPPTPVQSQSGQQVAWEGLSPVNTSAAAPWQRESFVRSPALSNSSLTDMLSTQVSSPGMWTSGGLNGNTGHNVVPELSQPDYATSYTPFAYEAHPPPSSTSIFDDDLFASLKQPVHSRPTSTTTQEFRYAKPSSQVHTNNGNQRANLAPENKDRTWDGGGGTQQVDAEWLLSLCEGDGFSLQMLNDMMRFDGSTHMGPGSYGTGL